MASISSMPLQRPKKLVQYGKSSSRSTYSTQQVVDFYDDDDAPTAAPSTVSRVRVKEKYTTQKRDERQLEPPVRLDEQSEEEPVIRDSPLKKGRPREAVVEPSASKEPQRPTATVNEQSDEKIAVEKSTPRKQRPRIAVTMASANKGVKRPAAVAVKPRTKKQDAFDVPSSEDEADLEVTVKRVTPARLRAKRTLVDDTIADAHLAPWEMKKAAPKTVVEQELVVRKANNADADQEKHNFVRGIPKVEASASPPARRTETNMTSAAARLAARRQQQTANISSPDASEAPAVKPTSAKRAEPPANTHSSSPRKRARKSLQSENSSGDVEMADELSASGCEISTAMSDLPHADLDVFDLPDDDAHMNEVARPKRIITTAKAPAKGSRRGKPTSSTISTPKKGLSAPARLAEMLPVDIDSTDAPSRSPSSLSNAPSTPRRGATPAKEGYTATPPARVSSSAGSPTMSSGTLTPKQKHLWSQLLPSDPIVPSPSALVIRDLTLAWKRRTAGNASSPVRTLTKSKSDVPELHRRRTRLVDRLKASALSSEEEFSEEDSDEEMEDAEVPQPAVVVPYGSELKDAATVAVKQSQSQSQTSGTAEGSTKITYARTRSYLPEDNLENGLIFDLPSATLQRPPTLARAPSKTIAASQKSVFDLDDSDEESGTGRLRSIHELRAAGRNDRFMRETEALLEDIVDHSSSARSRRRSGLIELVFQFADRAYVGRFIGQGFEQNLVAECRTSRDEIADFVLACGFARLLAAEPPEHVVRCLKEGKILGWLAQLLLSSLDISRVARDRKNNMAKSAQGTLLDFSSKLLTQQPLWGEAKPAALSLRLIALKAIDQLVRSLRRLGDSDELFASEQLEHVLAASSVSATDTTLSISTLESLSTSALSLAWPQTLLERLAALLPALQLSSSDNVPPHTVFLTFRLVLNLTNDNARNCAIFADAEGVVHYFLHAVRTSFEQLEVPTNTTMEEQRALELDLLVLGLGIMTNLAEHDEAARQAAVTAQTAPILETLLLIFQQGQQRVEEAESVEDTTTNVAFGYLAVMLANLCLSSDVRAFVAGRLADKGGLGLLVGAVEEFVRHHQKVDMLGFEGVEGREVWGHFTERLKGVLGGLRAVVEG
ncbi:hypothetical protein LTR08_008099 [Meristemomyces frigidus]|nr:hypothetical protein LTR08_008099 [Meristemomyces frigidus]